ncbi:hypothetical protein B0O99DRAFT_631133 [Bisporella sp. PMI_857]|nr:hypothetical protein B0O99DRAFT_631133 [Bisporella sp. PMI_857]
MPPGHAIQSQDPTVRNHQETAIQMTSLINPNFGLYTQLLPAARNISLQPFPAITFGWNSLLLSNDKIVGTLKSQIISRILSAEWLLPNGTVSMRCSLAEASKICDQIISSQQAGFSSPGTFLVNINALAEEDSNITPQYINIEDEESWKQKYLDLQRQFREQDNSLSIFETKLFNAFNGGSA